MLSAPRRRTLWLMRQVYLAATGMNRGKTTFALGLLAALLERGHSTAFTKPVGQRYAIVDDIPADEDAILMRATFGLADPYELMSPVHIPRGFTKAFIRGDVVEDLGARIEAAHARLAEGREALLIEGTGHAGVGAVVGLSNAVVAARLRAPAVIISEAGVGRPIDEIVLNAGALRAARRAPRRRRRQQGRTRRRPLAARHPARGPGASTASNCSACCPTGPSSPTPP